MTLAFLLAALVGVLRIAHIVYAARPGFPGNVALSPDGHAYLAMARGQRQPRTYHVRWLLPWLLGNRMQAWQWVGLTSLVFAAGGVGAIASLHGLSLYESVFAAVLFVALPLFRLPVILPVLTDGPALALAVAAVWLCAMGWVVAAVIVAAVGATVKEQVPIFAALAAWQPWLALGAVLVLARVLFYQRANGEPEWATHPFRFARKYHAAYWNLETWVWPWGAALAALFGVLSLPLLASLAVAYGVTFLTGDVVRNYQWAFLPMCLGAAVVMPESWMVPAAVVHWLMPYQGEL